MPGQGFPIEIRKDDQSKIARILIRQDWYDRLLPIYNYGKMLAGLVAVERVPVNFEKAAELIQDLIIEFGSYGWLFSLSIIKILLWAAGKPVSVGKFVYERISSGFTYGGSSGATLGGDNGGTFGGSTIQVKEITE